MKKIDHKGERVELSNINITLLEHIHRYLFAANFVKDKTVLDAACGTGYGSNYLSNYANLVYGIDINQDVIENNKEIYKKENLFFINTSIYQLPFDDNMFDVIVSFETIEHVDNGELVLSEFNRVLKKDGILIISTPNKNISIENNLDNPFHVHEYFEEEFKTLLHKYFNNVSISYQNNYFFNSISAENFNDKYNFLTINTNLLKQNVIDLNYNKLDLEKKFFIALASNQSITFYPQSALDGNLFLKSEIEHLVYMYDSILNSKTYKIGKNILYPIKFLLNLFHIKSYPNL
ncbi:MAG: class I SAM-dependent methyltransferase [Bacteroidales bacterium]